MSGKLNTKDVKAAGSGIPKTLQPGNIVCKINGIELEEFKFKEGGLHLLLHLESQPIDGFEGFLVNKDDPDGPKYKGQVGTVKASEWAFADGETKGGVEVSRDMEILKFLKSLCVATGKVKWMDDQDGKHETIESLIAACNKANPFKGLYLEFCLAGKEYMNRNNFVNFDLYLPKFSKTGVPFGAVITEEVDEDGKKVKKQVHNPKVIVYNPETHIKKKKADATIQQFGEATEMEISDTPMETDGDKDFKL